MTNNKLEVAVAVDAAGRRKNSGTVSGATTKMPLEFRMQSEETPELPCNVSVSVPALYFCSVVLIVF
ncbi:hypothetical protein AHAS_Ahas15G0179100 [Arachis hypogaea]